VGVKLDKDACTDCGLCVGKCKMDIRHVGDHECIQCGECIEVCPTNAIQWKGPKILLPPQAIGGEIATKNSDAVESDAAVTLQKAKKKTLVARTVAWVLALAVLGGALYYFNFVDGRDKTPTPEDTTQSDTTAEGDTGEPLPPRGNEVGTLCVSTELSLYTGGESFAVDQNRGKVTVINFWGTWCGPCIAELPHFEEVAKTFADTVTVVAVHSNYKAPTAAEWIAKNYPDTSILFAQDPDDGVNGAYYTALGGEGDFPMTIIVDARGVITFTRRGSLTHDELVAAVEEALFK